MKCSIIALTSLALAASQATAYKHGEEGEFNGLQVRWHQLAEGVFQGVPRDTWDDSIHKRGNQEWDVDEIKAIQARGEVQQGSRDLELEARNLRGNCQAVLNCVKYGGQTAILTAWNTWITVAEWAKKDDNDLVSFLNSPFVASAGGVAVAGIISGQVNAATAKECSTSNTEADVISAAVHEALSRDPEAGAASIQINGPNGSWTITVGAAPEGQAPNATC